jgi:UDP-N-acetylmuramate dehydrogenase
LDFAVERGYWGIENLALIPGTVGGSPVQNIGAYGVELKDTLENVEAYNATDGTKKVFSRDECEFGYRESVFKTKFKGQYFISAIILKLNKKENKNISYKILEDYLNQNQIKINSPKDISDAVSAIRRSKLPDPKFIGNAGSFFKKIFIDEEKLNTLLLNFPDLKYFKEENQIKIPSAWLIESCGPREGTSWKGYRIGNIGVHEKHALILVNYGGGSGKEIQKLSNDIIDSVFLKFGLRLIPEVNFI